MKSQTRACPVGCGPLITLAFRGVALDRCGVCAGVWFDAREYETLSRLPEAALHTLEVTVIPRGGAQAHPQGAAPASRTRRCPNCDGALRAIRVSPHIAAVMDHCDRCFGYWADDAELAAISEILESDKPYFAPAIAEPARRVMADAMAEVLTPREEVHLTLFQSLCRLMTRPIELPHV